MTLSLLGKGQVRAAGMGEGYASLQAELARGWDTWDTRNLLTWVRLPDGLAIDVALIRNQGGQALRLATVQPGYSRDRSLAVSMGWHALDGSYTDLTVQWLSRRVRVQSAATGATWALLITPLDPPKAGDAAEITIRPRDRQDGVYGAGRRVLDGPVAAGFGQPLSLTETEAAIDQARARMAARLGGHGAALETAAAVTSALGWDTIYDARGGRVITPVSRRWNVDWGGYVLFEWDTFFAAEMAGLFDRRLAYANALAMLHEAAPSGLVPNYASAGRGASLDRSEPPVGAWVVRSLFRRFHDRWFVAEAYPSLLAWNRWWARRRDEGGFLEWGTDPGAAATWDPSINTLQGAKYESGLDNSPLYDDAVFDSARHRMRMADVGLMGLYVADCDALADLADALHRSGEADELRARSRRYGASLATLWDSDRGIFLNRDLTTGRAVPRLAPTLFYPLLTGVPSAAQAKRMIREHLFNPAQFWGQWVLPAIARNDPAFADQQYWRGRIWGPMNFLVYAGLRHAGAEEACSRLADRSEALLLPEWTQRGHIHENYNALDGGGDDVASSDPFYHWGALLGAVRLLEAERAAARLRSASE